MVYLWASGGGDAGGGKSWWVMADGGGGDRGSCTVAAVVRGASGRGVSSQHR